MWLGAKTSELTVGVRGQKEVFLSAKFTFLGGVFESPVDTVGPGVRLDHGGDEGKSRRSNEGCAEEHDVLCNGKKMAADQRVR